MITSTSTFWAEPQQLMGEPSWSRTQVVGFEEETSLDNYSREMASKVLRAETNWESAEGCFITNSDLKPEMKS